MTDQQNTDVLAEIRKLREDQAAPAAIEGNVEETPFVTDDGFADLDSFFEDALELPVRGKIYRIAPADYKLGLLCSRLVMAGEEARTGKIKADTAAVLNDEEELALYERLLGHNPTLAGTGKPAVYDEATGELLEEAVPDKPNPNYDPERDVWEELVRDGVDWQRIQHIGATAMIWTALGKIPALGYWQSGGRPPKAPAAPQPAAPQDRKPKASGKSGRPGSPGGTTPRKKAAAKGTGGTRSSGTSA
jgi:hypothetical protein